MKMDEHARAWGHEFVAGILNQSALPTEQRNSLHWEILSHLHEAAERRVEARGGTTITLADLQSTVEELGGPSKLAAAFLENRVAATPRAGFWKRAASYVLDFALAVGAYAFILGMTDLMFPWGPISYYLEDLASAFFLATAYLYLVLMEVRYGQTVGKMVMKVRTVRVDGRPLQYREALIRNVAKVFPPLLVLDTLFYLLAFHKDDQRASDRLADTIVIDTARAVWNPPPIAPLPASPAPAQQFIPVDETEASSGPDTH